MKTFNQLVISGERILIHESISVMVDNYSFISGNIKEYYFPCAQIVPKKEFVRYQNYTYENFFTAKDRGIWTVKYLIKWNNPKMKVRKLSLLF